MPTAFKFPEAIRRDSVDGFGGLRMRKRKSELTNPQFKPADLLAVEADPLSAQQPSLSRVSLMNEEAIANGIFKAEHHDLYQGFQKGKLVEGSVGPGVLPESWNPVEKAKYDPVLAGNAFADSGKGQEQNNMRDKKTPAFDKQWAYKKGKGSLMNPSDQPNPFPIQNSHRIAFPARSKKTFDVKQETNISFKAPKQ
jgi:hypothetical protein